MHGAGVSHGKSFLNLSYHQDPGEHLLHLLSADRLDGIPDRAVGGHHRLRGQVKRVIPAFHTLGAFEEVEVIQLYRTPQGVLWVLSLLCIHVICNYKPAPPRKVC